MLDPQEIVNEWKGRQVPAAFGKLPLSSQPVSSVKRVQPMCPTWDSGGDRPSVWGLCPPQRVAGAGLPSKRNGMCGEAGLVEKASVAEVTLNRALQDE